MVNPHANIMKLFIKVFVTFFLSAYAFASFVAWDVCTIAKWDGIGRFAFMGIILFMSGLITGCIEEEEKSKNYRR